MDFKFGITWLFDKLGYMPKIKVDAGVLEVWPFPVVSKDFDPRPKTNPVPAKEKKVVVPKATTHKAKPAAKKPAVVAKTARNKAK